MRRYHQAIAISVVCAFLMAGGLVRAYLVAPTHLSSADVGRATRAAMDATVAAAIRSGGLTNAQASLERAIAANLASIGFRGVEVRIVRWNDLNPFAPFYFSVNASGVVARFDVEGTRDPLLAIRLGLDVRIRADPHTPYISHREPSVLTACLRAHYFHLAPEGPDLFARLENRTSDPYHFGFETLLAEGPELAADHSRLETGAWGFDEVHRNRYGL